MAAIHFPTGMQVQSNPLTPFGSLAVQMFVLDNNGTLTIDGPVPGALPLPPGGGYLIPKWQDADGSWVSFDMVEQRRNYYIFTAAAISLPTGGNPPMGLQIMVSVM